MCKAEKVKFQTFIFFSSTLIEWFNTLVIALKFSNRVSQNFSMAKVSLRGLVSLMLAKDPEASNQESAMILNVAIKKKVPGQVMDNIIRVRG